MMALVPFNMFQISSHADTLITSINSKRGDY